MDPSFDKMVEQKSVLYIIHTKWENDLAALVYVSYKADLSVSFT